MKLLTYTNQNNAFESPLWLKTMKILLLISYLIASTTIAYSQEFSADKLVDMLSLSLPKTESQLLNKKYAYAGTVLNGDTTAKLYEYYPANAVIKKKAADAVGKKFLISAYNQTYSLTYQTLSKIEFTTIIKALKKKGFKCDYETDSTARRVCYVYQHQDYTAEASVQNWQDTAWYTLVLDKKILPVEQDLHFAEDLLQFTSHEYLVYYFGAKNVTKDVYYFGEKDIASCSVLLSNTDRQVIFVWSDALNNRNINNLLIGGQHKLKSQSGNEKNIAENKWWLKCGLHAGMPLFDLRSINQKNIAFCGGDAPNPGLVFPESTGEINFKNKDVILGCMNCGDDQYQTTKIMYADKAMEDGRIFFVLTLVLYPVLPPPGLVLVK